MKRRLTAVAVFLSGLALTAGLDAWRARQLQAETVAQLSRQASHRLVSAVAVIQQSLNLDLVRTVLRGEATPRPQEIRQLLQALQRQPGVTSVLVAEAVDDAQRMSFESEWRQRYPDFGLRFRNATGQLVRSPVRPRYLPLVYGPQSVRARYSVGLDIAADSLVGPLLQDLGPQALRLSAPYREQDGQLASLLLGWQGGQSGPARLLALAISPQGLARSLPYDEAIEDVWFDVTDKGRAEPLYPIGLDNASLPLTVLAKRELQIGGRHWMLEARLSDRALAAAGESGRLQYWLLGATLSLLLAVLSWRGHALFWLKRPENTEEQVRLARELEAAQAAASLAQRDGTRLKTILDTTSEAIVLVDGLGRIEHFNLAAERLFAYSADEVRGLGVKVLIPQLDSSRQPVRVDWAAATSCNYELLASKKDGSTIPIELSLSPFTLDDTRYFVGVIRDVSDRKRAERMLFESEYKHRAILDAAHVGIYVLEGDQLRYVNPAFADYFGCTPTELMARGSLHELVASSWREALAVALDPERSGGKATEVLMQRPDGGLFYALITAKPILFNNQPGLAGSLLDISERKAAEQAMLRAEIRNVAILEAIPDLMLQLDASGTVVDCRGRAGAAEFGLARDVVGHHHRRLPGEFGLKLDAALSEGWPARVRAFEYSLPLADGEHLFEARITPASDGECLVMLRDITARKLIEAELIRHRDHLAELVRERTAELQALFAASPLPALFLSNRQIVEVNAAFEVLFQYPRAELIGQTTERMFADPAVYARLPQEAYLVMVGGQVVRLELRFRTGDGRLLLCEAFGKAIDPADPLSGSIWVFQDIGERRAAEDALFKAKELAETGNRAKSEFLANMSHELRTPMHAVLSFAELGERRAEEIAAEKLQHYFARIRQSGQRLLHILNDLLDLSKLEAGKMSYQMQALDLRPIIAEVADEFLPLARERGVMLTSSVDEDLPRVRGDALRLIQVLRNLLSNGIKFSPSGGTVSLLAWQEEGQVMLAVDDEGVGIPAEELAVIFDKFIQSSKTKTGAGGTGLGLAISREIVEAHDGAIRAENRPRGGARFVLSLRAMQETVQP
ncbi:PAS domain S-box protein [Chitinimonas sp.]|uniref:PAS domain S-box protein n=1 Tax=Chitinimonas sp. TaxID=1934313 RepID=UPI002F94851B